MKVDTLLGMKRETLVGIGIAGLLAGGLVGMVFAGPGSARTPEPDEVAEPGGVAGASEVPAGAPVDPEAEHARAKAGLEPVVAALKAQHALVHAADPKPQSPDDDGLPHAFREELVKTKTYLPILRRFYREVGTGALVSGGRLTPAGKALVAYLDTLDDQAIDTEPYNLVTLKHMASSLQNKKLGAKVVPPAGAGDAGPVMVRLLQAGQFDPDRAAERLLAAGGTPSVAHAQEIGAQLMKARRSEEALQEEYALEARLGQALLQLVLDMRIFRRAGPFTITKNEEAFAAYGDRPAKAVKMMRSVVEAEAPSEALAALEPKHPHYRGLVEQYGKYRKYAAAKCHKELPRGWRLHKGKSGAEVERLQERLRCEGYYDGPIDGQFDDDVDAAVKTYQRHHELPDEGIVGGQTLSSMNVDLESRRDALGLTLQRMRESEINDAQSYVIRVNIPQYMMEVIDDGKILRRHKTIIGTNRLDDDKVKLIQGHINRTQLFRTQLYEIVVNPDWILPERVEKGEIKAKLAEDPDYLKKNNIRKVTLDNGRSVLIQGRGRGNVLGRVKFLLKKSRAIFLHDTDDRSLFRHDRRDLSHGCIRVKGAVRFAKWLLERDGWDPKEIDRTFDADITQRGMELKHPVEVVTEYMTVALSGEGLPIFLTDIYGYDRDYFKGDLPPRVTARWGSPVLRPGWVPRVPAEVVEGWRRAGKPAPRNYKGDQ